MELDQGKIINYVQERNFTVVQNHFGNDIVTVLYGSNLLVSVSKFGIDTTKNPWYPIGIISI